MASASPKTLSTRLLLLLELHRRRHGRLRTLSQELGVTVQAVSLVLKRLTTEGLVENRAGVWRPTTKGTDAVHGSIRDLRRFVEGALGELRLIEECLAQAEGRIRPGDEVGLYMREGRLRAASKVYAGSHGRARTRAKDGDLVRIGDLRGIVALRPGDLTFVAHPETPTPAQLRRARNVLASHRRKPMPRLAAHALSSAVLLEQLGREPELEFAPLAAALDATRRGIAVQYWVPLQELPACMAQVVQTNGSGPQAVGVRSVEL